MKLPRPVLIRALAVMAWFGIGNSRRRLAAYRRKKSGGVVVTSNDAPQALSVRASVADPADRAGVAS